MSWNWWHHLKYSLALAFYANILNRRTNGEFYLTNTTLTFQFNKNQSCLRVNGLFSYLFKSNLVFVQLKPPKRLKGKSSSNKYRVIQQVNAASLSGWNLRKESTKPCWTTSTDSANTIQSVSVSCDSVLGFWSWVSGLDDGTSKWSSHLRPGLSPNSWNGITIAAYFSIEVFSVLYFETLFSVT